MKTLILRQLQDIESTIKHFDFSDSQLAEMLALVSQLDEIVNR